MPPYSVPPNRPDRQLPYVGEANDKCLYVYGIPADWNEWHVFDIFRHYGIINNIKMAKNIECRRFSYCFINMMTLAGVDSIMEKLDGNGHLQVQGLERPLRVEKAYKKDEEKADQGNRTVHKDKSAQPKQVQQMIVQKSSGVKTLILDEQRKCGEPHGTNKNADKKDRSRCYGISHLVHNYRALSKHDNFHTVRFSVAVHRHIDLPRTHAVPVDVIVSKSEIHNCPPFFYAVLKDSDVEEDKQLQQLLENHFANADPLECVEDEELVLVRRDMDDSKGNCLLRALVNKVSSDNKVVVFALDTAERIVVPFSNIRSLTPDLAEIPFRTIPCSFYGISNIQKEFAETSFRLLTRANLNAEIRVKLICFSGSFNIVQLFIAEGEGNNCVFYDFGQKMAESKLCNYLPPTNQRIVYSREEILQLIHLVGKTPVLDEELAKAICM